MANLKDLLVNGPSSLIGDVTVNKIRLTSLEAPTASSGSTYGSGSSGQILKTNGSSVYWADDVVSKLGAATVGSSSQPIYLNNGIPSAITSLGIEAGGTGKNSRRKAGLFYNWTTSLQGQIWSRICYIPYTNSTTGSTMILNIRHTRSSVVYNETVMITVHHNSRGNITSLSSSNYNQNTSIQVRALANSSGNCYIELKDSSQGITEGTTISSVYCTLQIITLGNDEPILYTSFQNGTTLPENYSVATEVTLGRNRITTSGIFSGNLEGNAATATALATGRTLKVNLASTNASTSFNGTANITDIGVSGILPVSNGGTGKTSFTGNRLIFSPTSSTFENAQKIYVKNETNADAYMAINKTSITSGYNFEVNGNSSFAGHIETLQHSTYDLGTNSHWWRNIYGEYFSGNAETATAANLTTITNSIAYYNDTIGTFTSTSKIYTNGTKLAIGQNIAPTLDSYALDIEGNVQIVGDLKVNALTPEINSNYTLSLTNSNWTDIESIKGNILTDGTYIIQIYSSFSNSQKAYWSGIFSWTESNDTNIYNEIPLHGAGYLNNSSIYLRTTGKVDITDEGKIKTILQIKANKTISNQSFTIKIKKII